MHLLYTEEEVIDFRKMLEKIIFSKDIKRLNNKTQLFSSNSGDHYRNRLTHTLEVVNISKNIAVQIEAFLQSHFKKILKHKKVLSMELLEAIAYGHDLGHTPFGHIGERTLQNILKRKDDLGGLIFDSKKITTNEEILNEWKKNIIKTSFFKHNVNSLELLIENNIFDWRILDGVLKHTNISFTKEENVPVDNLNWLKQKLSKVNDKKLYDIYFSDRKNFVSNIPLTLEAQIVAISDEIAQVYSDLDDTLRYNKLLKLSKMLNIKGKFSMEKTNELVLVEIKEILIKDVIEHFKELILCNHPNVTNQEELSSIFSFLKINYFVFKKENNENEEKLKEEYSKLGNSKMDLSIKSAFYKVCFINFLKSKYSLKSEKVRMSDAKAKHIIRQLFKAYYNSPDFLNDKIIEFIKNEYYTLSKTRPKKKFEDIIQEMKNINSQFVTDYNIFIIGNSYMKAIANYIAKMTDDYALMEYKKIYL